MDHEVAVILYAAGRLDEPERTLFEKHLAGCLACQEDLRLWQTTQAEIVTSNEAVAAPPELQQRLLDRIHRPASLAAGVRRAWYLLRVQSRLVQREMWPASAAIMALGLVVGLISNHIEFVYFFAPLVAAASLALIFSPENDAAHELTLATRTSPWKVLLARLSIVAGYNLFLALAAGLVLLAVVPSKLLGMLVLGWLGPMAFLSALALLISLWIGTGNAILVSYALWMAQFVPYRALSLGIAPPAWESAVLLYRTFWHSPVLLLLLSTLVTAVALWCAGRRPVFRTA